MAAILTRNESRKIAATTWETERSLGDFMKSLYQGVKDTKRLRYIEDRYRAKAAMSSTSGVTGGYLVPIEYVKDIWAKAQEASLFLKLAQRVPLTSAETTVPHVSVSTAVADTSPFFGGLSFGWGIQNVALTETEPTFTSTSLKANTLAGYGVLSNQLLQDSEDNDLDQYFKDIFAKAAAWHFDLGCFRGTGTVNQMPTGVINAPGRLEVTRTGGSDVQVADLAKMIARILPCGWAPPFNACWALHPSVLEKIGALTPWQVNQVPFSTGSEGQLYIHTLPAYPTEKLPALGSRGDVVLFIPQLYLVGVRQEIEVSISTQEPTLYLKNQSAIRMVFRGDGQPRLPTSVTLADGTKTASAYVVLL